MLKKWFRWLMIDNPASATVAPTDTADTGRSAACNRLKLVLMHDRTQLEPEKLALLRDELVAAISKYIPIDKDAIELNLEKDPDTNTVALVANIPVMAGARLTTEATLTGKAVPSAMATPAETTEPADEATADTPDKVTSDSTHGA
jgi:cell division topological specificity factor